MSWFDEQIRQRKQSDQELFEDSIFQISSVVLGKRGAASAEKGAVTKAAIDDILRYYRYKPAEIPASVTDPEEQLEYCLRPHGVMHRGVKLEEGWYRDAYGPMLAYRAEDGLPVALLPRPLKGYYFLDPNTGERASLNKKTAAQFEREAICFYRPLPKKKLGIPELILYLKDCLSASDYVVLVGLTLLATLTGLLMPRLIHILTGLVPQSGSVPFLIGTAVFMVCVTISTFMIGAVRELGMNRIQIKTSLSLEAALMARVMSLPAGFFRKYSAGELSHRFGAVNQLCDLLVGSVFSTGLTALMSLLYITQIFSYAPALVLPALCIIAATVGVGVIASLMQMKIRKKVMEAEAEDSGISYALITGVQKIKLAGAEKRAFARWARSYSVSAFLTYNPPLFLKAGTAITAAISLAGNILLYYLAVTTRVSPSEYTAFNAAYGTVMGAFVSLTSVALTAASIRPILNLAKPILQAEPESSEGRKMVTSLTGSIELSNVYFRYTDSMPYVVDGMSLRIKAGEYIAIVGATGCGKSTLMRLMLGFETPEKGAIYYDGMDMSTLELRSLRRRIGAVTQDGSLFQGDIFSNIVISAPQLTLTEAWQAAELAGIADDIREMPMGMQTVISEGQGGISGGQKQRLMIARAIAPKPKILMFDEATSALDNRTQKQVSDALDNLQCTRIVIAHRLSTIRHCDRILVLDKGRIVQDGTYDELIAQEGLFAELVARQRLDAAASDDE